MVADESRTILSASGEQEKIFSAPCTTGAKKMLSEVVRGSKESEIIRTAGFRRTGRLSDSSISEDRSCRKISPNGGTGGSGQTCDEQTTRSRTGGGGPEDTHHRRTPGRIPRERRTMARRPDRRRFFANSAKSARSGRTNVDAIIAMIAATVLCTCLVAVAVLVVVWVVRWEDSRCLGDPNAAMKYLPAPTTQPIPMRGKP